MRVLFVAPRAPHPQLLGYQVRAYHQLRILGRRHAITLVAFATAPPDAVAAGEIAALCEDVVTVPLRRSGVVARVLCGALAGHPLQTALYDAPAMRRTIAELLRTRRYDLVHVQLARMAPHLERGAPVPRMLDLIDALSLNMRRRSRYDRGPTRWASRVEAGRLGRYERSLCRLFDHATVVSEEDRRAIGDFPTLTVNANGVDLQRFPFAGGARDPRAIVLSGNLGYFPNVDAATWFVHEVLPRVRRLVPDASLALVGARPHRRVRGLVAVPGVTVSGLVRDLHPWLARSAVAVAPMRAGSGQPLKVLEAMASGTPVVATSVATAGIAAVAGRHHLAADDADGFASHVVTLLRKPERGAALAVEARRLVEERYGWDRSVAELEATWDALAARRAFTPGRDAVLPLVRAAAR